MTFCNSISNKSLKHKISMNHLSYNIKFSSVLFFNMKNLNYNNKFKQNDSIQDAAKNNIPVRLI